MVRYAFIALYLGTPFSNLLWNKFACNRDRYIFVGAIALIMWLNPFGIAMHLYPVLFFYIEKIIRKRKPENAALPAAFALMITIIAEAVVWAVVMKRMPEYKAYFDNYGSILPVVASTCFFLIFYNCKCDKKNYSEDYKIYCRRNL